MTHASRFLRRRRKLRRDWRRAADLGRISTGTTEFRSEAKRQARLIAYADTTSDIMDWLERVSMFDDDD